MCIVKIQFWVFVKNSIEEILFAGVIGCHTKKLSLRHDHYKFVRDHTLQENFKQLLFAFSLVDIFHRRLLTQSWPELSSTFLCDLYDNYDVRDKTKKKYGNQSSFSQITNNITMTYQATIIFFILNQSSIYMQ